MEAPKAADRHITVPLDLLPSLRRQFKIVDLVETGTKHGTTTEAIAHRFRKVWTIELNPALAQFAAKRLERLEWVEVIQDNSVHALGRLAEEGRITRPTFFWLDAHWSGDGTSLHRIECPALEEIAVIRTIPGEHVVGIDDARLFDSPPPPPHDAAQWPRMADIRKAADGLHVQVVKDAILITPRPLDAALPADTV